MTIRLTHLHLDQPDFFPSVELALTDPDGLLAFGGDLSSERLINAYRQGIFPWFGEGEPYLWWSPSVRAILKPSEFHVSRSLQKHLRKNPVRLSINQCFSEVIKHCALSRGEDKVWITKEMRQAYTRLHNLGQAHSIEIWQENRLIGGLYGLSIGAIFCAESMFSVTTNASKIALWQFSQYFAKQGGELIECQMLTPHLESLGVKAIARSQYIQALKQAKNLSLSASTFTPQFFYPFDN